MRAIIVLGTALLACLVNVKSAGNSFSGGQLSFSLDFFKSVGRYNKGNLILSPLSAHSVLSMAAFGARGKTAREMRRHLRLPLDDNEMLQGFSSGGDLHSNNNKEVTLEVANNVLVSSKLFLNKWYEELLSSAFNVWPFHFDFSKAYDVVKFTNDWCSYKTHNKIKQLIKPDDIDPRSNMILLNAVYFKGKWAITFDPEKTTERPFHLSSKIIKNVPTMYRKVTAKHGHIRALKAEFLQIPYADNRTEMLIILPNEIDGLKYIEENLDLGHRYNLLAINGFTKDVSLYLPKFKIESSIDLQEGLENMGLGEIFTDLADFSGITRDANIKVDKVIQKAVIEVNEEGTESTAVTGLTTVSKMLPKIVKFAVDRPFYYFIRNPTTTLFAGRIIDPTQN